MSTFLFDEIIFGPVKSRRLGISLGINLLPYNSKFCNFNCIYCECGWTKDKLEKQSFHSVEVVEKELNNKLLDLYNNNIIIDVITFAGNGEPTLHPFFDVIIDLTIKARNKFFPKANIAVLTNGTMISKPKVFNSLNKIEQNILKIDSVIPETIQLINGPLGNYNINSTLENLKKFNGNVIIQTLFVKGYYNNVVVDNTSEIELTSWIDFLLKVKPKKVMIYTIARDTPVKTLEKVNIETLEKIANLLTINNIKSQISS
jgi:wyosine [tRNA(Phe)-imidazoG37] synthetase (radical SAM superfamily)